MGSGMIKVESSDPKGYNFTEIFNIYMGIRGFSDSVIQKFSSLYINTMITLTGIGS